MSVEVARGAGSGELILAGCGGFDAGECVGFGGGGALNPGHTEVGGCEDGAGGFKHRGLILTGGR